MSTFYVGTSSEFAIDQLGNARYLYAIRRNDDGELFFRRIDQLTEFENFEVNSPGDPAENLVDFEEGIDFVDGIDEEHEKFLKNLVYPQFRWDKRSAYYYIDQSDGQLVLRYYRPFAYPEGISS